MIEKYDKIEFFYNKFYYSPWEALIPRLETESLVREAIKIIKNYEVELLIDVWTWTWIIPISVEKNSNSLKKIFWLDISYEALEIAKLNLNLLNSNIVLLNSDLLSIFLTKNILLNQKIILITANLPYIKEGDFENIWKDVLNEPELALFWWQDTWFELYIKFFEEVFDLKNIYENTQFYVICEFWFDQEMFARNYFDLKKIKYIIFFYLRWINRFISYNL